MSTSKLLTTKEVQQITNWSLQKIRQLIHANKLPAVNTSPGKRATFLIRQVDLDAMLTPAGMDTQRSRPARVKAPKQVAIDSHVPNVFGKENRKNLRKAK